MPRPTLLIGFGSYGLDALQRLLHQSALRGVLRWQETQSGGVASAQRQLQGLALLALPDPFERATDGLAAAATGAPQFLTDLYRQIKGPTADPRSAPGEVAQRVRRIGDELLAQTGFDRRDPIGIDPIGIEPIGLDLIVLAHPSVPDTIPHLDILLQHCLESLADSSFFKVAVQGAENLNCVVILDFDDYWQGAGAPASVATARALRAALRNSMQGWERRRAGRQVAVDRCYLVDGRTAVGYRPPHVRLDEVELFLELLLFEGLRTSKQALYQQQSLIQPVAATFGIRLLEESTLVRSREAAATFGRRWLDALIGDEEQCPDRSARRVHETLAPLRRDAIERRIDDGRLEQLFEARAEQLVTALMAVPERQAADWLERVQEVFVRERQALEQTLDRSGWELVSALKEAHLKDLDQRVVAAVDADLHDERAPTSLRLVCAALAEVRQTFDDQAERRQPPPATADPLDRLAALHQRYRDQLDEWLAGQGRALQWFWPLFALLLALGLATLSTRLVYQIDPPGQGWLDALANALRAANHPLSWTLWWFVCLWAILALKVQPLLTGRIARAQRFFMSAQRGRFHDHLRDLVDPLRASLLARVRRNLRSSLANDVQKTLTRIGDRLAEREREMHWLRRQLSEFLRLSSQPAMAVRHWVRRAESLETIMQPRPLARICYPQDDVPRPFAGWSEPFCDAFLDPLGFIDRLSKCYADADERMQERRTATDDDLAQRRRELIDFIDQSKLAPACRFLQDTGVTDERRWCIAAPRWRNLPGMVDEIGNRLGIVNDDIVPAAARSRVYLLVVQTGVAAVNLERGEGGR